MGTKIDINELYQMIMAALGDVSDDKAVEIVTAMSTSKVKPIETPTGQRWWKHEVEQWLSEFRYQALKNVSGAA